jgi:hypothetical protein
MLTAIVNLSLVAGKTEIIGKITKMIARGIIPKTIIIIPKSRRKPAGGPPNHHFSFANYNSLPNPFRKFTLYLNQFI